MMADNIQALLKNAVPGYIRGSIKSSNLVSWKVYNLVIVVKVIKPQNETLNTILKKK